jgi:hypothetical protein
MKFASTSGFILVLLTVISISCTKEKEDNSIGYEGEFKVTNETGQAITNYGGNRYWANINPPDLTGKMVVGDGEITFNNLKIGNSHIGYYQDVFNTVSMYTALQPLNGTYTYKKVGEDSITINGLSIASAFIGSPASYPITGAKVIPLSNPETFKLHFYIKDSIQTSLSTYFSPQINQAMVKSSYEFYLTFVK